MSEFKSERGENPEQFLYSRDSGSREDVRPPEENPENTPEESLAQEEDDGWRESDFQVDIQENDGDADVSEESDDEDERRRNRRKARKGTENESGVACDGEDEVCPEELLERVIDLWCRVHRQKKIDWEFIKVIINERTIRFLEKLLSKTSTTETCDTETSETEISDVEISDVETFDVDTSDTETSSVNTSNVETFNAEILSADSDEKNFSFLSQPWEFQKEQVKNEISIQANENDTGLDVKYYEELIKKKENLEYNKMCAFREMLPAHRMKDNIVQLIHENQVSFISGGTGCGKTTQIVQFVLDDWIMRMKGSVCNIVCTQPRRVSASSVARRIAAERLEPLSLSVGYQIRFENKLSERKVGCINFVTTGVLLQWLVTNPLLPHVSHIFLDEVHEKTIEFDAVMVLLKEALQKRPDFRLILMSATVDSVSFCKYFGGAPDLEIPGYTFPVEEFYLDDIINMTGYSVHEKKIKNYDPDGEDFPCVENLVRPSPYLIQEELDMPLIGHLIGYICMNEGDGGILVFLPGLTDMTKLKKKIEGSPWYSPEKHIISTAHSILPAEAQRDVFTITPEGKRKIILATSIMETSITLDDITYVVDSGKMKCCSFDINQKVSALNRTWISTANAKQRKGRVGRTKPGKCYKLYTKEQEDKFVSYPPSDIQMTSLTHIILETKLMRIEKVGPFLEKMMDPPHPVMVEAALKELKNMNALDDDENMTALGYHLSKLPMDVRTGKMILMGALFSCIDPIFSIAACLTHKDPFNAALDEIEIMNVKRAYGTPHTSDHTIFCDILRDWEKESPEKRPQFCSERYLSYTNLSQLSEVKKQFATILHAMNFLQSSDVKDPASNVNSKNYELIKAILYAGLYPSVATTSRRTSNNGVKTTDGHFALFHGKSYLSEVLSFDLPFFVYFYKLKTSTKIFLHDASMIEVVPLLLFSKSFKIIEKEQHLFVELDEKLNLKITKQALSCLRDVKIRLEQIIGEALLNSEGFDWRQRNKKIVFLRGVVTFISISDVTHKICNAIV